MKSTPQRETRPSRLHFSIKEATEETRPRSASPAGSASSSNVATDIPRVPAPLLAPRYSHLLEEAVAIGSPPMSKPAVPQPEAQPSDPVTPKITQPSDRLLPSPSVGNRLKGFLTSYLPKFSRPAEHRPSQIPRMGLPLPPRDVLEKPRGPVATPARRPPPKITHPRDQITLHSAPAPPSGIPRPVKVPPRRLVDLQHVSPPPDEPRSEVPRPRRSSSGSVKDLIQSFEILENQQVEDARRSSTGLRRVNSLGSSTGSSDFRVAPRWRP